LFLVHFEATQLYRQAIRINARGLFCTLPSPDGRMTNLYRRLGWCSIARRRPDRWWSTTVSLEFRPDYGSSCRRPSRCRRKTSNRVAARVREASVRPSADRRGMWPCTIECRGTLPLSTSSDTLTTSIQPQCVREDTTRSGY